MHDIPRSPLLLVVVASNKPGSFTCLFQYLLPPVDAVELYYHDSGIDMRAMAMPALKDTRSFRFTSKAWRPTADLASTDGTNWVERVQTLSNTPAGLWRRHLLSWAVSDEETEDSEDIKEFLCPMIASWAYTRVALVTNVSLGGYKGSVPNLSNATSRMANLDIASMRMLLTDSDNSWERVLAGVRSVTVANGYRTDPMSFQTAIKKMVTVQTPFTGRAVLSPSDMRKLITPSPSVVPALMLAESSDPPAPPIL